MIPFFMRLKIHDSKTNINLFLPLIILYIPLLLLGVFLLPLIIIGAAICSSIFNRNYFALFGIFWEMYCCLRDFKIDVRSKKSDIKIAFY